MSQDTIGRRKFLEKAMGAGTVLAVAPSLLLTACDNSTDPTPTPTPTDPEMVLDLSLATFKKLANVNGSITYTPPAPNSALTMVITRIDATTFSVVSSVCTHQGCIVDPYDATSQRIACGCHGSRYDINGAVKQGPAATALKQYKNTYDAATNKLTISDAAIK